MAKPRLLQSGEAVEGIGVYHSARYFWQAASVANIDWNSRKVFGNAGRGTPIYYSLGYAETTG
jgi:hypothetical protein